MHDLIGLFRGRTSLQADKVIAPFKGLWIRIQGKVNYVGAEGGGSSFLIIIVDGSDQAFCRGQNAAGQDLSALNSGDTVRIEGKISPTQTGGALQLNECQVRPPS
jgi:hypothetical protein